MESKDLQEKNLREKILLMKKQVTDIQDIISEANSNASRCEGEIKQMRLQKSQLEERCQNEFGMSIKDLKRKLPEWVSESEKLVKEIESKFNGIETEIMEIEKGTSGDKMDIIEMSDLTISEKNHEV